MKDSDLYTESTDYVKDVFSGIYNVSEDCDIISISRKGPKALEMIFGREHGNVLNTITEVALPFYAMRMAFEKKTKRLVIFDDAIYFGTTVEGIYRELKGFETLYNLNSEKQLYTAIRSKESKSSLSKNLEGVEKHSFNDDKGVELRSGFGHYFIRRLEESLSNLNNTLEVEFPIVEFKAESLIDRDKLFDALVSHYGDANAFVVDHYQQKSLSICFNGDSATKGMSFKKMRIYVDGNIIRVVCMSPWILPNDITVMQNLFDDSELWFVWINLMKVYTDALALRNFKADYFLTVERCIRKSLIIMANYLFSYRLVLEEKDALMENFEKATSGIRYIGVNDKDLFYLLGDAVRCDEISKILDYLWRNHKTLPDHELVPNIKPSENLIDYQVFENENFPEYDELKIFKKHNQTMVEKCRDLNEALSAMFFNQTALIEKWSRRSERYDFGRLRFGYTYHSLYRDLINAGKMNPSQEDMKVVNKWLDHRIEQACVVPQYVVDNKTNQWCRVFRPGENEDALLNHLARFVLAVFKMVDGVQGLGWVYEHYLREMLCLSAMQENAGWQKSAFEFELIPDAEKRTLKFRYDNQSLKQSEDVLDYMFDMGILSLDKGMVSISEELEDDEIAESMTLEDVVTEGIDKMLKEVTRKVLEYKYQNYTFFVTNLYFYTKSDITGLRQLNGEMRHSLEEIVSLLEQEGPGDSLGQRLFKEYYKTQKYIVSANLLTDKEVLENKIPEEGERNIFVQEMIVLWIMKSMCELLITSFFRSKLDYLNNEVESSLAAPDVYGYPLSLSHEEARELQTLIEEADNMEIVRRTIISIVKNHIQKLTLVKV